MDEKLLELITSAGGQTTVVGGLILIFFYLRRAEAGMRGEMNESLARLRAEKQELLERIDVLEEASRGKETLFDTLREERRAAQDEKYKAIRDMHEAIERAEDAEEKLRKNGLA